MSVSGLKWHERQPTDEELTIVAWNHMLCDATMTVYTVDNGRINRNFVNPKLAIQRIFDRLGWGVQQTTATIMDKLFPSLQNLSEVMNNFHNKLIDAGWPVNDQGELEVDFKADLG